MFWLLASLLSWSSKSSRKTLLSKNVLQRRTLSTLQYLNSPLPNFTQQCPLVLKSALNEHNCMFSLRWRRSRSLSHGYYSQKHRALTNLLYWKQHYASITSIQRLFKNITKHKQKLHFSLRSLGHFSSEVLARHKELCIQCDFMSVLHVLFMPGSKHAEIKFNQ